MRGMPHGATNPGGEGVPMNRCWWCADDELYQDYHDNRWGKLVKDDAIMFKMLTLEHFQAGLSWITILRKEPHFDRAFAGWDIARIATFGEADVQRLLTDAGIIRHRGKIEAAINNAAGALALIDECGSLYDYFKRFVPRQRPVPAGGYTRETLPLLIDEAGQMSKDLKKRGFRFTGPMCCMSFMQAVGLINDHVAGCDLCIH